MKRVLVIGYGNTLRGDDAAGVRAAERISALYPEAACRCVHQLSPEIAADLAEADEVFFLDASVIAAEVQAHLLTEAEEEAMPESITVDGRSHFVTPAGLVRLCKVLYERCPIVWIVGIPASELDFREELSERTSEAVDLCVEVVGRLLMAHP